MSDQPRLQGRLQDCTAVILMGGLGTRLRSVVCDRPKPLAQVNGRPFITYLLDQLADTGLQRVVLCTGYMGDMVEVVLGQIWRSLELIYSPESMPLGTGGALRLAAPHLQSATALVMNGDSYCDVDWATLWTQHQRSPQGCTIVLTQVQNVQRFGQVTLNTSQQVIQFAEKGQNSGSGWINAGIYLLPVAAIAALPAHQHCSLETDLLTQQVAHRQLRGVRTQGLFIDIGLPDSYQQAQSLMRDIKLQC
ncbi:MAG: NTP transferase domain-containing protein [Spirulina sp. SIO3F2]|nr:NTP transferase domain-containing protein [Spirulina sp. SIO3F2]